MWYEQKEDRLSNVAIRERRKHPRKEVPLFMVFRSTSEGDGVPHIALTRDISEAGVFFYTPAEVSTGQYLLLTIYAPCNSGGQGKPSKLAGEGSVVRTEKAAMPASLTYANGIAVKFAATLDIGT